MSTFVHYHLSFSYYEYTPTIYSIHFYYSRLGPYMASKCQNPFYIFITNVRFFLLTFLASLFRSLYHFWGLCWYTAFYLCLFNCFCCHFLPVTNMRSLSINLSFCVLQPLIDLLPYFLISILRFRICRSVGCLRSIFLLTSLSIQDIQHLNALVGLWTVVQSQRCLCEIDNPACLTSHLRNSRNFARLNYVTLGSVIREINSVLTRYG